MQLQMGTFELSGIAGGEGVVILAQWGRCVEGDEIAWTGGGKAVRESMYLCTCRCM